ncbi:MAG TPA: hypothetical protein VJU79_09645, partial [Candidatus Dormibacteraeota bacterium]|nr:hypothetical protein [Candidatus Dormibacteraeota bacterium]
MTVAAALLTTVAACAWLVLLARTTLVAARMLQIEEYEVSRLVAWGSSRSWLLHRSAVAGIVCVLATIFTNAWDGQAAVIVAGFWLLAAGLGLAWWHWTMPKRALVYTARMRRLLALSLLIGAAVAVGLALGVM